MTLTTIKTEDDKELALDRIREIHSELDGQESQDLETSLKDLESKRAELDKQINSIKADLKELRDARKDAEKPLKKELADLTKLLGEYEASKAIAA